MTNPLPGAVPDLAAIRALLAEITLGTVASQDRSALAGSLRRHWAGVSQPRSATTATSTSGRTTSRVPATEEIVTTDSGFYGPKRADAEFIAAAPTIVRDLLAAVDALTQERDRLKTENNALSYDRHELQDDLQQAEAEIARLRSEKNALAYDKHELQDEATAQDAALAALGSDLVKEIALISDGRGALASVCIPPIRQWLQALADRIAALRQRGA